MNTGQLWRRIACSFGLLAAATLGLRSAPSQALEPELPGETAISSADRQHWSFRPLRAPGVPKVEDKGWSRTPIDNFVISLLQQKGVQPAPEAHRTTLLRRVTFDLRGLPPTPQEISAFLADDQPDAYERLVDRLLSSPAYGEKWGQHWLDLARFAETDGFEHDHMRPLAWQYRDWVIGALNEDMPYSRFVGLQLAGDEIAPDDKQAQCATGFCVAGPDMPDINSQEERRHVLLNEMTGTVGAVFLGLQIGCAQCHDHKYDPISQGDFYRLRACFDPAISVTKDKSVSFLQVSTQKVNSSHLFVRGDWRSPGPEITAAFPRIANPWNESISSEDVHQLQGRRSRLAKWLTREDHPLTTRVIANRLWQYHFGRGLSHTPSDFGLLGDEPLHVDLLDWLAGELVRRDWSLKKMHRLIVTSATYRQASDVRFQISDFRLQNKGVTTDGILSDTSQSEIRNLKSEIKATDPDNRYLAHFDRRRLSGEELRDAMFHASETLDMARGGPGIMPPLPAELMQTLLKSQWTVSPRQADHYRRSVYIFARRNLRYPIFDVFDRPDGNASCPERSRSTTAPQSLHLLNSEMSLDAARRLAGYVISQTKDPSEQIGLAVMSVLGRAPTTAEISQLTSFLDQQQELLRRESRPEGTLALPIPMRDGVLPNFGAAFTDLSLALFNLNEFLYVD